MIGRLKDITLNRDGSQNVTVTIQADFREDFDALYNKDVEITIKKASVKRSLDANAFLWALCSQIAERSSKYSKDGKNDVYREAIRAKGVYTPLLVPNDGVEQFLNRWSDKGTGWFAEVIDDYNDVLKIIHAYYGSSTYTTAEMSHVIDYVVLEAEDLGIPTITPKEMERLLGRWTVKKEKRAA